jgi:hypothetical protein
MGQPELRANRQRAVGGGPTQLGTAFRPFPPKPQVRVQVQYDGTSKMLAGGTAAGCQDRTVAFS